MYSSTKVEREGLSGAALSLDDALRRVPGFGLFRRQAARASHPTTQGVSLRGLGPNGAGRTLVLLDGVPLNDPFGGWVEWVHLPPAAISQATIIRGGGAGPWGNAALAGVVRLDSRGMNANDAVADVRAGSRESISGFGLASTQSGRSTIAISAHGSTTDGYFFLSPQQRGLADQPAARESYGSRLIVQTETGSGARWSISASAAADRFTNGSHAANANTETYDIALSVLNDDPSNGPAWEAHAYARYKDFSSVFAAFDEDRASVRPVLDQYDVPATAVGANALLRWSDVGAWSVEGGADIRFAEGETNELFRNLGAGFTRDRHAGGSQFIAGTFLEGHLQSSDSSVFTVGARADYWRQSSGVRRETDLGNGSLLVDTAFPSRDGVAVNGRLGFRTEIASGFDLRAAAYSGFRIPTLNELYRPFRVGNDITEANAALRTERMGGAEAGLSWTTDRALLQATVFRNDLFDPIINATVTTTPGFNVEFGQFIPAGGSLRQRRNVDRVRTYGFEADADVTLNDTVSVSARYLYTDPKVTRSDVFPAVDGNRLAQVPRHQATLGVTVRPAPRLRVSADVLASSDQFEDDLNSRELSGAVTLDLHVTYDLTDRVQIYTAAENLFDTRVEAGRSADGLVTLGPPVFLWAGVRLAY